MAPGTLFPRPEVATEQLGYASSPRFLLSRSQISHRQVGQGHAVALGRQSEAVTAGAAAHARNIRRRWRQILAQRPQRNCKLRAMPLQAIPLDGRVPVVVSSYALTG